MSNAGWVGVPTTCHKQDTNRLKRKFDLKNSKPPTNNGEGACVFCPFRYGERRLQVHNTCNERDLSMAQKWVRFEEVKRQVRMKDVLVQYELMQGTEDNQ